MSDAYKPDEWQMAQSTGDEGPATPRVEHASGLPNDCDEKK
jgi:hypothetical protein